MADTVAPSKPPKNGLKWRIISAVVLIPAALLSIHHGAPYFDVLVAGAVVVMAGEWAKLCGGHRMGRLMLMLAGLAGVAFVEAGKVEVALLVCLGGALPAYVLGGKGHRKHWMAMGAVYVALPAALLLWLRLDPDHGRQMVYWLCLVVWATDIGAYAFGRAIGGPKLAPRISPNKTWAGLFGGMLSAGAAGVGVLWFLDHDALMLGFVLSALLGAVSQMGDLFESFAKRRFGVKDSGSIIPGHGGLLDRVDGLLAGILAVSALQWAVGGDLLAWM